MATTKSKQFQQELSSIIEKIVREFHPRRVILFGSRISGTARPESDVDLLIVQESKLPRRERQRAIRSRLFPPSLPLDLLVYTPEEVAERERRGDFFIREILEKGKTLYAAP